MHLSSLSASSSKSFVDACWVQASLLGADVGQSAGRISHTLLRHQRAVAPCVLPGSSLWIGDGVHRPLLGREALSVQGWPIHAGKYAKLIDGTINSRFTDKLLANMAGNAFPGPCIASLLGAILLGTEGRQQPQHMASTSKDEAEAALALLGLGWQKMKARECLEALLAYCQLIGAASWLDLSRLKQVIRSLSFAVVQLRAALVVSKESERVHQPALAMFTLCSCLPIMSSCDLCNIVTMLN